MLEGYTALAFAAASPSGSSSARMVTGVTYRHPGILRQDGHHARRALRRPRLPRHRRGVERGGAPRARRALPAAAASGSSGSRRRCRSRTRCGRGDDSPFDGQALPARAAAELPAGTVAAAPADPGRRQRREEVAAARRAVRRRVQHLRDGRRRACGRSSTCCASTARPSRPPLRARSRRRRWAGSPCPRSGAEGTVTVDQAVQRFGELAEIGVDQAIVSLPDVHDPATFELVPALVEQLAAITPAGR